MGCGAHLLVVGAEQKDEQRLRKAVRNERSVHLRGDDTSDGEAPGAQMSLFRQFQSRNSRKPAYESCGFWPKECRLPLPLIVGVRRVWKLLVLCILVLCKLRVLVSRCDS